MKRRPIAVALLAAAFAAQPLAAAAQGMMQEHGAQPHAAMQTDPKLEQQMMDRMKSMQAQMDRIHQNSDPKEREKLLAEHMKSMQEGMQMMRGMGGGRHGAAGHGAEMMQGRMGMMQMMMDQMLEHQKMMQQAPAK